MVTFTHTRELKAAQFIDVDLRGARFVEADLSGALAGPRHELPRQRC